MGNLAIQERIRPGDRSRALVYHRFPMAKAVGFPILAWQISAPDGTPVVRERYWVTFQPGEIRLCDGCHGVNELNQTGQGPSSNEPEALRLLIQKWKADQAIMVFGNGFEGQ